MSQKGAQPRHELAGDAAHLEAEEVAICVLAMTSALPLVNPTTTGLGMKRTAVPKPKRPATMRMTPAIIVHMKRPSTPYRATIAATTTTKAPVRPPI